MGGNEWAVAAISPKNEFNKLGFLLSLVSDEVLTKCCTNFDLTELFKNLLKSVLKCGLNPRSVNDPPSNQMGWV